MKRWIAIPCVLLLAPRPAPSDIGVFRGSGSETELWSSGAVRLLRESITVVPVRGPLPFDGTGAGASRFEYDGLFTLRNDSDRPVKLQAGYPLDVPFPDDVFEGEKPTAHWVAKYKFTLFEEGNAYAVRFTKKDLQNRHRGIFLWDMAFEPGERRTIRIRCTMPFAVAPSSTARHPGKTGDAKLWYAVTERGLVESLSLGAEPGTTWSGSVGEAEVRLDVKAFESGLERRGWAEREAPREGTPAGMPFVADAPTLRRVVAPEGGTAGKDGAITWRFLDAQGAAPIDLRYCFLDIPRTKEEAARLVQAVIVQKRRLQADVTEEDLADLGDILKACHGRKPDNARIQSHLDNQVWYPPADRDDVPAGVLETIASYQPLCPKGSAVLLQQVLKDRYEQALAALDAEAQRKAEALRAARGGALDDVVATLKQQGLQAEVQALLEEKRRLQADRAAPRPIGRVAGELAGPPFERITLSAVVDGSGKFVFTKGALSYRHFHWGPPQDVRIDGQPWHDLDRTPPRWTDVASRVSLETVRILERSGRDVICVEPTAQGFEVYVADSPNDRDTYSITLGFYPK